jgi:hypothetical protein
MGRLLIAALWLGVGAAGIYTFLKHRDYVAGLPADPDNDQLKQKFKRKFYWSLSFVVLGIWWALSVWFPSLNVHFK